MTAAHCTEGIVRYILGFGSVYVISPVELLSENILLHPAYNPKNLNNDIALIKTPTVIPLGPSIKTIRLPAFSQASETFEGRIATVSGWGRLWDSKKKFGKKSLMIRSRNVRKIKFLERCVQQKLVHGWTLWKSIRWFLHW